jgi:hypothetical protein
MTKPPQCRGVSDFAESVAKQNRCQWKNLVATLTQHRMVILTSPVRWNVSCYGLIGIFSRSGPGL